MTDRSALTNRSAPVVFLIPDKPPMSASGWIRTAALVLSPSHFGVAGKNLLLWLKALTDREARETIDLLFDSAYYRRMYEDVRHSGIHPRVHYMVRGFLEGRRPSSRLDNDYYRFRYKDVGRTRINPVLHYALFGKAEGRSLASVKTKVIDPRTLEGSAPEVLEGMRYARIDNAWPDGVPLVSVVVPCFNYGRYLEEALESVLNQTFQDFEIIVVEGGSTDGITPGVVRGIEARKHPKIRVVYRAERHLAGDNRNLGIAQARGRYVCCLDADDALKPVYLEVAVFLAEAFGLDVITSSLECFGESSFKWMLEDPSFPAICMHNQIATTALYRRDAWVRAGGYRDWGLGQEHIPEDWDFWVRLLGHGYRAKSIREALMSYRVHATGLTATCETDLELQREAIQRANEDLLADPVDTPREMAMEIANRWANIVTPVDDGQPAVLVALPFITVGGAEQLFHNICSGLRARGLRVIIITTAELPETVKEVPDRYQDITPHVYSVPRLFDPDVWPDFLGFLIRRYDVRSILLAGSEFLYNQLPNLRQQFPHLRIVDQQFNDTGHIRSNRTFAQFIDRTSVPSRALANILTGTYQEDPSRVAIIPHGIDTRGPSWDPEPAFQASGLPERARGKLLVSFFGRMSKEKSPETFVKIAAKLSHRKDLFFLMTGEGPEWRAVKRLAARHRLANSLHLPGFVKDPRPLMELSGIVVLTSAVDGMPLVVLESGALAKPVVASSVGSLPEMVLDGETGYLCLPGDVKAFCAAIEKLAGSEPLRRQFGDRARRHVYSRFSQDTMVDAYVDVLGFAHHALAAGAVESPVLP